LRENREAQGRRIFRGKSEKGLFQVVAVPCSGQVAVCLREIGVENHPGFFEALQQRLHLPLVVSRDAAVPDRRVQFGVGARVGKNGGKFAFRRESQIAAARYQDDAAFFHDPSRGGDSFDGLVKILVERIAGVGG
jgi:hypothetical protein